MSEPLMAQNFPYPLAKEKARLYLEFLRKLLIKNVCILFDVC